MECHKSQAKLTRTQSSLLRSSPTVRSSISFVSSAKEMADDYETVDLEEQKPHGKPYSPHFRPELVIGSVQMAALIVIFVLFAYSLFIFSKRTDWSFSENLLLLLIFVAMALFFVSKKKSLIHQNFTVCKTLCDGYAKRMWISCFGSKSLGKPVQWYIGDSSMRKMKRPQGKKVSPDEIVRERVDFYCNGDFYEGEFHNGKCNGSGVYNYFAKGRYEGDWVDGRYDGHGIESWARGSRYRGQFRQGMRHGYGIYKFFTGDTYAGEWYKGQSNGVGEQTCADLSCYIGQFKCGVKHGIGYYHFRNGDRYAGEYFSDKIHGFGIYHFANGHCYEGSWHEGRKQGYGMYTFRNNATECGEWDSGNLKTPLPFLNAAVLEAVQAARKIADNAVHLLRVDEQVNISVMAAQKAATAARVAAVKAVQNKISANFAKSNF